MGGQATGPLVCNRVFAHDRVRVFEAFASAEAMQQWFSPAPEFAVEVIEYEFRERGRYRIAFSAESGERTVLGGEFIRILNFSWCWEPPDPHSKFPTTVTVEFLDRDGATEVVITHENWQTVDAAERHRVGWVGTLDRLQLWTNSQERRLS